MITRLQNNVMYLLLVLALTKEPDIKKWPEWECVRWTWSGDVYNRKVICLEWRKRENKWTR